jgi:hypothetical protein
MTSRWLGSASIKALILETLAMVNESKSFGERERERERTQNHIRVSLLDSL